MISTRHLPIYFIFNVLSCIYAKDLTNRTEFTKLQGNPRIINGTIADWDGTRYQVSVRLKERDWYFGNGHICGGSLISANAVLTAAHCIWDSYSEDFRSASEFSVVFGNLDRYLQDNNSILLNVSKISTTNAFNISTYRDDIAILFLDGMVPLNSTRSFPIALNENLNIANGTVCTVSGWGKTETGFNSAELRTVDVEIIDKVECIGSYGDYIQDGMICAGYMSGERDACSGDSGGPLACDNELVGVVSFGEKCALPGNPGVYADVARYISWIRNETGIEGENAKGAGSTLLLLSNFISIYVLLTLIAATYIS